MNWGSVLMDYLYRYKNPVPREGVGVWQGEETPNYDAPKPVDPAEVRRQAYQAGLENVGNQVVNNTTPPLTPTSGNETKKSGSTPFEQMLSGAKFGMNVAQGVGGASVAAPAATTAGTAAGATGAASACCFIFLEAGMLTDAVRRVRDELFTPNSYVARGYRAMAAWLVPWMRKSRLTKGMVRALMTHPIALFCERKNPALILPCLFWCVIWELYGRIGR